MANITSLGIGSGIDLESLVNAYIDAEAIPQEIRLQEKEDRLNLELSGVGSFKSAMDSFNTTLEKLTKADAFNKQVATSSSTALTVKSNGFASNGTFKVDVQQIAQGSRLQSTNIGSSANTVGSGILTFTAGLDPANTFDVAIDAADDLSAIRDKINAQSGNFGVTANIINADGASYLVYNSSISGDTNNLSVTTSDPSLNAISISATQDPINDIAKSAKILVDGNLSTSDTNEFKNIIEDLTITVTEKTVVGSPAVISVSQDSEHGKELVEEFISGYNALVDNLTGLGAPKQGRLAFDPNVRQVKSDLANIAIQAVGGLTGSLSSLNDIGLELNKEGKLEISKFSGNSYGSGQQRLDNAFGNLTDLGELFASPNGIATQMENMIDGYIASDGVLTQRANSLTERVGDISNEWEVLETRLRSYEDTLRKQFSFLDGIVAQYNATGDWLTSTLSNLTPSKN